MASLRAIQVIDDKFNARVVDLNSYQEVPDQYLDNYGGVTVDGKDIVFRQRLPIIFSNETPTFNAIAAFLKNYLTEPIEQYFTVKKIHQGLTFTICSVTLYTIMNKNIDHRIKISLIPKVIGSYPKVWYENCNVLNKEEDGTYFLIHKPPFSDSVCYTFDHKNEKPIVPRGDYIFLDDIVYKKALEVPTLHTFAYSGFFKPTLPEVYTQLPHSFDETKKFLISTNIISPTPHICIQGDYHVAITTVWTSE